MGHNKQDNSKDIDGRVVFISQPKYISEKFSKMILVMEVFTGERRNEVPFTFSNARMDCLKNIKEGDWVNVQYQLSGQRAKGDGEPRWFTELQAFNCIKG